MERLFAEVLSYGKTPSIHAEAVELHAFVRELVPSLQRIPAAQGRIVALSETAGEIVARADREKVRQVLMNLVSNACEAIGSGEAVTLVVRADTAGAILEVHNGGPPVAPAVLARVVEPFFTTKSHGTGLGLPIVARIVEAHGGRLAFASDETGTTVTVVLPFA